ncbi:MAG TPA: serine/threonine-protein kinase, partial [Myxococcaceae bacterium]|nr:serine/threonine-protein kinase [Myxococcaceae bacterium]
MAPGTHTVSCNSCHEGFYLRVPESGGPPSAFVSRPPPARRRALPPREEDARATAITQRVPSVQPRGESSSEERTVLAPLPKAPPAASGARSRPPRRVDSRSAAPSLPPRPAEAPAPPAAPVREDASPGEDVVSLSAGTTLGGYQLLRQIGGGSMGAVWLARQLSLDRGVAVKVLRPSLAGDPQFVYRFTQEALAAAQLVHHNIAQIYDCGSDKGVHFFSMEFVDDESLAALVEREGRLDPEVAAGYILQAARGLQFAHTRGMVHRDIKPDNLLLNRNGIVKVADLGLVKKELAENT